MDSQLENIFSKIQKNKRNVEIKIDINQQFIQNVYKKQNVNESFLDTKSTLLPNNKLEDVKIINNEEHTDQTSIYYKQNEVLDLPNILSKIIDLKQFYTYGINKKVSLLDSMYMILDPNYTLETEKSKNNIILETIKILLEKLDVNFKNNKYRLIKCKKPIMKEYLDKNILDHDMIKLYLSDFFKINLVILDLSINSYVHCNSYDLNRKTIIFLKQFDYYLPIVNILGHIFESNIIEKIKDNFKEENNSIDFNINLNTDEQKDSCQKEDNDNLAVNNLAVNNLADKNLINLEKIWKYNLNDLQEMAKKLDIDVYDKINGKNKRKTKDKLYSDIRIILN